MDDRLRELHEKTEELASRTEECQEIAAGILTRLDDE
jgi:hypothetical protein